MSLAEPTAPPLSPGACAALACIWEATAPKPGNVYRGADFDDMSYVHFLTSALAIAPVIDRARKLGVGRAVLEGVAATRAVIGPVNTNLGILLLIAPLAAVPGGAPLTAEIGKVLERLTLADTRAVYAAIRLVRPGGLGRVAQADVNDDVPNITLLEAMELAAERDLVARQYANGFPDVFALAERLANHAAALPLGEAIVRAFLEQLRAEPDTLIARKCGLTMAREVSGAAASVLECLASGNDVYQAVLADFDFWLRSDGHKLNPGSTADLIAAALFVLLREERLNWPVCFYGRAGD
jgi:triphosphoribosyl-dephospho-CoA synthase